MISDYGVGASGSVAHCVNRECAENGESKQILRVDTRCIVLPTTKKLRASQELRINVRLVHSAHHFPSLDVALHQKIEMIRFLEHKTDPHAGTREPGGGGSVGAICPPPPNLEAVGAPPPTLNCQLSLVFICFCFCT